MALLPPNIYEPARGLEWLHTVLNPIAGTGGAWLGLGPDNATTPFIVYSLMTGNDLMVVGAYRVWNDGIYQVKVVGPSTSMAAMATMADAVDNALQRAGGVSVGTDSLMLSCTREQTLVLPEAVVNGVQWINLISLYRIYVQAH